MDMCQEENYKKNLEKFRHYQEGLANLTLADRVELFDISRSFVFLDEDGVISIQSVPLNGDYVYIVITQEKKEDIELKYDLKHLSDADFAELNYILKKCLIIEELRNKT